ncbi:MAG: SH3 domain-containing protein [Geminicoccaceae bacterium]
MRHIALGLVIAAISSQVLADGRLWVTADHLNRRTCPSSDCGIVGQLFFRESVEILERQGQWARISKRYDAACEGGKSAYVDRGNSSCKASNGINDGMMAEWISIQHISRQRPPDPAAGLSGIQKAIASSDDFHRFGDTFQKVANELIRNGNCSAADFKENGGWIKSTTTYKDRPVYFTYCGGITVAKRLYLDASTGQVFR